MTVSRGLPAPRHDGWTPDRRRTFLAALAEGHTVEAACAHVGMSVASAYALRRRADGEAFALGWRAANLLGRDRLADILASRAIDGQVDTVTRADGETVVRHRYDNRLATTLLARLDRLAAADAPSAPPAPAMLHLGTPAPARPLPAPARASASVVRHADAPAVRVAADWVRFLDRVGSDAPFDPHAFAAGRGYDGDPQHPQLRPVPKGREWLLERPELAAEVVEEPFWYDEEDEQWLTNFPPPPDFEGTQYGAYGFPNYARTLTGVEELVVAEWDARAEAVERALAAEGDVDEEY